MSGEEQSTNTTTLTTMKVEANSLLANDEDESQEENSKQIVYGTTDYSSLGDDEQEDYQKNEDGVWKKNGCFVFFRLLRLWTIVACGLIATIQMLRNPDASNFVSNFLNELLRCCFFVTALIFVMVEYDIDYVYQNFPYLQNWVIRGFCYLLFGTIVGLLQSRYYQHKGEVPVAGGCFKMPSIFLTILIQISGYSLCLSGFLYLIAGLLCLKQYKQRLEDEYQNDLSLSSEGAVA